MGWMDTTDVWTSPPACSPVNVTTVACGTGLVMDETTRSQVAKLCGEGYLPSCASGQYRLEQGLTAVSQSSYPLNLVVARHANASKISSPGG